MILLESARGAGATVRDYPSSNRNTKKAMMIPAKKSVAFQLALSATLALPSCASVSLFLALIGTGGALGPDASLDIGPTNSRLIR